MAFAVYTQYLQLMRAIHFCKQNFVHIGFQQLQNQVRLSPSIESNIIYFQYENIKLYPFQNLPFVLHQLRVYTRISDIKLKSSIPINPETITSSPLEIARINFNSRFKQRKNIFVAGPLVNKFRSFEPIVLPPCCRFSINSEISFKNPPFRTFPWKNFYSNFCSLLCLSSKGIFRKYPPRKIQQITQ